MNDLPIENTAIVDAIVLIGTIVRFLFSLLPLIVILLIARILFRAGPNLRAKLQDAMAQAENNMRAGDENDPAEFALDASDLDAVNELRAAQGLPPLISLDGGPDDSPNTVRPPLRPLTASVRAAESPTEGPTFLQAYAARQKTAEGSGSSRVRLLVILALLLLVAGYLLTR